MKPPRRPPFREADGSLAGHVNRPEDGEGHAAPPAAEASPQTAELLRASRRGILRATRWLLGLLLLAIALGALLRAAGCTGNGA